MVLPALRWRRVTWREGSNTELNGRFTAVRGRPAHRDDLGTEMRAEEWLLIEWPESEAEPTKYWSITAQEDASLEQMVFDTKMRWRIERNIPRFEAEIRAGSL